MTQRELRVVRPEAKPFKVILLHNVMSDWSEADREMSADAIAKMKGGLSEQGYETIPLPLTTSDIEGSLKEFDPRAHVVFNWCEGIEGYPNGYHLVPPVLEKLGFAYTGADAWSLETTLDKAKTKTYLVAEEIPTPESKVFERPVLNGWRRYPALVKPAAEHCSYGITRDSVVDSGAELKRGIEQVLERWKQPALVEDFIDGVEYNVSIWGNGRLRALPLASLDYSAFPDHHDRLCTYDAKWDPDSEAFHLSAVQCPTEVPDRLRERIESVAEAAYRALRLRDYGRIDLRVRRGIPYVFDVNSNPDITMEGGLARSARAAGYDYGQLTARIVELAARRMKKN
ncbi:MAG: ATP-grasp domain-containing protein [Chloroflexi bacterium]|nr:ATP-grasp domain-containing protein [Chloroflexota bacterium]